MRIVNRIGLCILILGVALLITGIVLTITVGTIWVPICISSSVVLNSAGIMMLRARARDEGER